MTIHETTNTSGTSTLVPTSSQHVEYVRIKGEAPARELVIDASQRSKPGTFELGLLFVPPLVEGIVVTVRDASSVSFGLLTEGGDTLVTEGSGAEIARFESDGIQANGYLRTTVDCCGRVKVLERSYPAF